MTDPRILALLHELNAQGFGQGTVRCPVCGRDRKFSVTIRDDGLALWICHRASCGVRGAYALARSVTIDTSREGRAFVPRPLERCFRVPQPDDWWYTELSGRRQVSNVSGWSLDNGFRVLEDEPDTCVWELRNLYGELIGHQTRTREKRVEMFYTRPGARYAAFRPKSGERCEFYILVEDCMSAALWKRGTAIALLGTNLTRASAGEIANYAHSYPSTAAHRWYVALDPDALRDRTPAVVERLRAHGLDARILPIDRDIKDMTHGERTRLWQTL